MTARAAASAHCCVSQADTTGSARARARARAGPVCTVCLSVYGLRGRGRGRGRGRADPLTRCMTTVVQPACGASLYIVLPCCLHTVRQFCVWMLVTGE